MFQNIVLTSARYSEDRTTAATFKGPITHSSESTVITSASAAIVASVVWPDLTSPCSLAGIYLVPRPLVQRSDGSSSFATVITVIWQECMVETYGLTAFDGQNKF